MILTKLDVGGLTPGVRQMRRRSAGDVDGVGTDILAVRGSLKRNEGTGVRALVEFGLRSGIAVDAAEGTVRHWPTR